MNIGNHLLNNYDSGIQGKIRLEQSKMTGNVDRAHNAFSDLKEGSVFKGEILDVSGGKVTISLEDQSQMQARLQEDVELSVGDILLFSVKENSGSQVLIKPMFDSLYSAQTQTLEKVLSGAGLSPTEKNFSAAKELMDAGMPVDKGSLVKVLSQSMKYPEAKMSTIVSLNKMNIPVTGESIGQYERYLEQNHQLTNDILDTSQAVSEFVNFLPENLNGEELLHALDELIEVFSGEDAEEIAGKDVPQGEEASLQDNPIEQDELSQNMASSGVQDFSDAINVEYDLYTNKAEQDMNSQEKRVDRVGEEQNTAREIAESDKAFITDASVQETEKQVDSKDMMLKESLKIVGFSEKDAETITKYVKEDMDGFPQIQQSMDNPAKMLSELTDFFSKNHFEQQAVREILNTDGMKKLIENMVKDAWSMNPQKMSRPEEIDEMYHKIQKQSQAFENLIQTKGGDAGSFQQNSQNMRQNMDFIQQLNQQMIYAQMPLKLSNQQTNSELYVYADKRRLMEKKDGISVMLHLDMDHLGKTDIKVTLTGKNVNARFYLNDQQSVNIVADNMEQLAQQLNERGFSLTNEVVKRKPQESVNKVIDEIIDENAEKSVRRYTFDVKM